jgi:hypothetical protein
MRGLDPRIHVCPRVMTWMAGPGPAMTSSTSSGNALANGCWDHHSSTLPPMFQQFHNIGRNRPQAAS